MMKTLRSILMPLFGLVFFTCAPRIIERFPSNDLGKYAKDVILDPGQAVSDWGIYAVNLTTGKTLIEYNADKLFLPASNTKLYTTSAALNLLGSDYRYQTHILATGPIRDGVLEGDLVILGHGDPSWSARFYEDDPTFVFRGWADSLKARGITAISGDIVGVDAVFDDFPLGAGWIWGYESYYYSAQVVGLSFNENTLDFTIEPGIVGEPPTIIPSPATAYVDLVNNLVTLDTLALLDSLGLLDALSLRESLSDRDTLNLPDTLDFPGFDWDFIRVRGTNRIVFTGHFPADDTVEYGASVEDPVLYTATVLLETLLADNIKVRGTGKSQYLYQDGNTTVLPSGDTLFVYHSPPLDDIVYHLNKDSQNFMAENLLRTIGTLTGRGGSGWRGRRMAKPVWAAMGVDTNTTYLTDGSGLSSYNRITPRNTANLLINMHSDSSFVQSLPIAGIDGTLKNMMKGTAAEGRVFAKTGTLRHARALSGYAHNHKGDWIAFSILVNDYLTPLREVNNKIARICELLVLQ
ncbi:D-alanyl-D-alanine carboxypeptidase/D-alanyl-D-alanine-endopeptidase [Candidatus Neomarinimicrobiota bacterium]